jgi:hypothetical protein
MKVMILFQLFVVASIRFGQPTVVDVVDADGQIAVAAWCLSVPVASQTQMIASQQSRYRNSGGGDWKEGPQFFENAIIEKPGLRVSRVIIVPQDDTSDIESRDRKPVLNRPQDLEFIEYRASLFPIYIEHCVSMAPYAEFWTEYRPHVEFYYFDKNSGRVSRLAEVNRWVVPIPSRLRSFIFYFHSN